VLGVFTIFFWLDTLAYKPQNYADLVAFFKAPFGLVLLFGWTAAVYYHLCNGIRHLLWDAGIGFELKTVNKTGPLVIIAALALTLATWGYVWL
jgi:succinate dehydrogenase / fumarate reductase cytochrome b subunit